MNTTKVEKSTNPKSSTSTKSGKIPGEKLFSAVALPVVIAYRIIKKKKNQHGTEKQSLIHLSIISFI